MTLTPRIRPAGTPGATEQVLSSPPRMSVILATDTYATIRPVIAGLRRQAIRDQLEVVIVTPAGGDRDIEWDALQDFAAVRVVPVERIVPLAPARAAGVRAATAPIVFIGETHTYAQPGWAEALLKAFEGPWSAVVPAIGNANPRGALSWAGYISDYANWGESRPAGEMSDPLIYNTAYRRSVLVALGEQLDRALDPRHEDAMWSVLRSAGHRAWFEPAAVILHVNSALPRWFIAEKFFVGVTIGSRRAARWSWPKRLAYLVAAPAIPVVLVSRLRPAIRGAMPVTFLPAATIPTVIAGAIAKTAGEVLSYAGLSWPSAEDRLVDIEVHKAHYANLRDS